MPDPLEQFRQTVTAMELTADCGLYVFTHEQVYYFPTIYHAQAFEDYLKWKGLGHD